MNLFEQLSFECSYELATKDIDQNSFDSVNGSIEYLLNVLERNESQANNPIFLHIINEIDKLKERAKFLLEKEEKDIIEIMKSCGISESQIKNDLNND